MNTESRRTTQPVAPTGVPLARLPGFAVPALAAAPSAADRADPAAAACCGPSEQETCCAPAAKSSCCGAEATSGGGCGCR